MEATLDLHPEFHNEFHLAPDTESEGNCCCWKSKPAKKKEFVVKEDGTLVAVRKAQYKDRIEANQRLSELLKMKFDNDPIDNNKAFELLKKRINDPMQNGDPITSEKLAKIILAIHQIREEIS